MNKHILLTGGAGFIGSHTVEEILTQTDMEVIIIDRLSYAGNLHRLAQMNCWEKEKPRVKFVYHDFRSKFPFFMKKIIGEVDYIIHMGAETHVYNSFTQPVLFAQSNVIGTINMLELAKDIKPEKFVYVGFTKFTIRIRTTCYREPYSVHSIRMSHWNVSTQAFSPTFRAIFYF